MTDEVHLAAAYLSRVAEPASLALWRFVRHEGYEGAAAAIRRGAAPPGVRKATDARRTSADPEADLDAALHNGIRLVMPEDSHWPHVAVAPLEHAAVRLAGERDRGKSRPRFRPDPVPPLALWVRGDAELLPGLGLRSVAVVGSRAATSYGEHVASEFGFGLAARGVCVVSGGAFGIDAAAHRGALGAGGEVVLVSAAGPDRPYPAKNEPLFDEVVKKGLLVSERPPGSAPHKQRFLARNRLIAAFGGATVLVEAAHRSGALNTAGYCRDLGRPLLVVPGPVTSAMSVGCHQELQRDEDPARLVASVQDVMTWVDGSSSDELEPVDQTASPRDLLDEDERRVLDGLQVGQGITRDVLMRLSGQPSEVVDRVFPTLQRLGLADCDGQLFRLP